MRYWGPGKGPKCLRRLCIGVGYAPIARQRSLKPLCCLPCLAPPSAFNRIDALGAVRAVLMACIRLIHHIARNSIHAPQAAGAAGGLDRPSLPLLPGPAILDEVKRSSVYIHTYVHTYLRPNDLSPFDSGPHRRRESIMPREAVDPHILDLFETLTGPHRVRLVFIEHIHIHIRPHPKAPAPPSDASN